MNYVWGSIIIISVICALVTNRIPELSSAVLSGSSDAVNLIISISGMMALWTGLMKIAQKSGVTSFLTRMFSPLIHFLFPGFTPESPAAQAICMNMAANLLGLGNAATPLGITAMKEMQKLNNFKNFATNEMIMFVVINTASLQLVPSFLCVMRQNRGSENPLSILPCLWISSMCALMAGVSVAKIFEKAGKRRND